jgi:hypothetical protein
MPKEKFSKNGASFQFRFASRKIFSCKIAKCVIMKVVNHSQVAANFLLQIQNLKFKIQNRNAFR